MPDGLWQQIAPFVGVVLGAVIGYLSSYLQWKRQNRRERLLRKLAQREQIVEAIYDIIEYIRDYHNNLTTMELNQFKASMTGKNPTSRLLALAVTSAPELKGDVMHLVAKVDAILGPEFPVPAEKLSEASAAANALGNRVFKLIADTAARLP